MTTDPGLDFILITGIFCAVILIFGWVRGKL